MMKGQKGITLVALIITIIVMLILVAVTISIALNGGLFDKARTASKGTRIAQAREAVALAKADIISDYYDPTNKLPLSGDHVTTYLGAKPTYDKVAKAINSYLDADKIQVEVTGTNPYTVTIVNDTINTDITDAEFTETMTFDMWASE